MDGDSWTPRKRPGLRDLLCKPPRAKVRKTNAEMCREYREKLKEKENADKLAIVKAQGKVRAQRFRSKPISEEEKARRKEMARQASKRYRESRKRQAHAGTTCIPLATSTPKTRKAVDQQREKWRLTKRSQRENWGPQKRRRHRERSLNYYYSKKEKLNADTTATPSTPAGTKSRSALCSMSPQAPQPTLSLDGTPDQRPLGMDTGSPEDATLSHCASPSAPSPHSPLSTPAPTHSKQAFSPQSVHKNTIHTVNYLKHKRSKASITLKKSLQTLLRTNVSPVKTNLYNRKQSNAIKKMKGFLEEQAIPLPSKKVNKKILPKKLKWLHKDFLNTNPDCPLSLRTMYRHIPKEILSNQHFTYRQCLCEICTNVDLKLEVLNRHISKPIEGRDEFSERSLCHSLRLDCLERVCGRCGVEKAFAGIGIADFGIHGKWKCWEMVEKETGKRRELVDKEGDLGNLVSDLKSELKILSKHLFVYRWQYAQFQNIKSNLPVSSALAIFDFAENFLCKYQNEVQSAHWSYNQVTLHPCVLYYACKVCLKQVTDYLVVLSDDLHHDAHFVRKVTECVKSHLSKEMDGGCSKLIIFSDGCGAQYKSKLPFFFLAKDSLDIQVQRCFFGSRHGKSPCDSCGGIVKKLVSDDVVAGNCIIQNASAMHQHCSHFLTLPPQASHASSRTCCHVKRSFALIDPQDVERSVESKELKTVLGTQKIHDLKRVDSNTLLKRNLSCFCAGCLSNSSNCENNLYVLPWEPVNIPDLWSHQVSTLRHISNRNEFFSYLSLLLSEIKSFPQLLALSQRVSPLLASFVFPLEQRFLEEETFKVDSDALLLCTSYVQNNLFPCVVCADGNCLPRALSFHLFGNESHHKELRCRIAMTLACHSDLFLDSTVWSIASDPGDVIKFITDVSHFSPSPESLSVLQQEAVECCQGGKFMGLWQLFASSFVLQRPIRSVFPEKGWMDYRTFCNRIIYPPNAIPGASALHVLWSSLRHDMTDAHWVPNHFVPLLPMIRPKTVEVIESDVLNNAFIETTQVDISPLSNLPVSGVLNLSSDFHNNAFLENSHNVSVSVLSEPVVPKIGSLYYVEWSKKRYVAEVLDVDVEECIALIRFMQERENLFFWPEKEDVSWESFSCFCEEVVLLLDEVSSSQRRQLFSCSARF